MLISTCLCSPLAPARLESIKNSYSELNLLSKLNASDFIFDFGNAVTGVSIGTGGRQVSATVSDFDFIVLLIDNTNYMMFSYSQPTFRV